MSKCQYAFVTKTYEMMLYCHLTNVETSNSKSPHLNIYQPSKENNQTMYMSWNSQTTMAIAIVGLRSSTPKIINDYVKTKKFKSKSASLLNEPSCYLIISNSRQVIIVKIIHTHILTSTIQTQFIRTIKTKGQEI